MRVPLSIFFMTIAIMSLLPGVASAQPEGEPSITVISEPFAEVDQVFVELVVRDAQGFTVGELDKNSFGVSEGAEDLDVIESKDRSVALAVIVNLSRGSDVDLIRESLLAYMDTTYQEGDTLLFYILGTEEDPDEALFVEPPTQAAARDLINNLTLGEQVYNIASTLEAALLRLQTITADDPDQIVQALYAGSFVDDDEVEASSIFAEAAIPLHVVQSHRDRSVTDARALAENGGGRYANNINGNMVSPGDVVTATGTLREVYNTIDAARVTYLLTYRTLNEELEPFRTVTVDVTLDNNQRTRTTFLYEREFRPPQVIFPDVTLFSPTIESRFTPEGEYVYSPARQIITLNVVYPDGIERSLRSLRVEVTDRVTNNVVQSTLLLLPQRNAATGLYEVAWNLNVFDVRGVNRPIEFQVTAMDILGLTTTQTIEGVVSIGQAPPTPTPLPPTSVPEPTAVLQNQSSVESNMGINSDSAGLWVLYGVILILAVALAVLAVSLWQNYRLQPATARRAPQNNIAVPSESVTNQVDETNKNQNGAAPATLEHDGELVGRLLVLKGLDVKEILIDRDEFVIGRLADEGCDYVIPEPYISPRHCMFVHQDGNFILVDLESKNGTFVNGERLPKKREVFVPIGSEIEITRKIKVEIWDPHTIVDAEERIEAIQQQEDEGSYVTSDDEGDEGLIFRGVPGIGYMEDDEGEANLENYSPF